MEVRLCGFGGLGAPAQVVCGEWIDITGRSGAKKFNQMKKSCDFANRNQGPRTHWIRSKNGDVVYP